MENRPYIVCCICKNESKYIEEFIEYHLELGFDKIIIGDNNDINGERYDEQLKDYIDYGEVEIINLRGLYGQQISFYNHMIKNYDYEWCAFIDCDEFITFAKDSKFTNIKDFLNSKENVFAYALNWMVYGDNERVYAGQGDVVDRFKKPMPEGFKFLYDFPENNHVKSILNRKCGDILFKDNPHMLPYKPYYSPSGNIIDTYPFNPNIDFSVVYIRHFYTKSLQEWCEKKLITGNVFAPYVEGKVWYPVDYYFRYNKVTDAKIKYLKQHGIEYKKKL